MESEEDEDFLDESKPGCSYFSDPATKLNPEPSTRNSQSVPRPGNHKIQDSCAVNHVICSHGQSLQDLEPDSQDYVSLNFKPTEWRFLEELTCSRYKKPTSLANRSDLFKQPQAVSWESLGVLCATGKIRPMRVVDIHFTEDRNFLVFDEKAIRILREEYRIISVQLSPTAKISSPGLLLPEQAQVLVENGFARVIRLVDLLDGEHIKGGAAVSKCEAENVRLGSKSKMTSKRKLDKSENGTSTKRSRKDRKIRTDDELRDFAVKSIVGRIIKEEKRQKFGADAPSELLRVTDSDRKSFKGEVTEEEIVATVTGMRTKLAEKDTKFREREELPYAFEVMEQPPFPTDPTHQKRLTVFRDLWRKGFYMTGGTKFGCDYLAYEGSPDEQHSRFMVVCVDADLDILRPLDLIGVGRVATQVKKRLLLAVATQGSLIPYYIEAGWWKGDK
ncbi:tRNA-splicing endonuclease subunit Sen34 [Ditylenchus destructor]|uniref:tRNA-intron lyase n=1 Tax=Ditylenchus destructor TaxID=166010 RepID=A0AAD4QU21_9BILA|nr:tRNA-splicing endonuclease subunit Sen34 [Ditylenchus destructor]